MSLPQGFLSAEVNPKPSVEESESKMADTEEERR